MSDNTHNKNARALRIRNIIVFLCILAIGAPIIQWRSIRALNEHTRAFFWIIYVTWWIGWLALLFSKYKRLKSVGNVLSGN